MRLNVQRPSALQSQAGIATCGMMSCTLPNKQIVLLQGSFWKFLREEVSGRGIGKTSSPKEVCVYSLSTRELVTIRFSKTRSSSLNCLLLTLGFGSSRKQKGHCMRRYIELRFFSKLRFTAYQLDYIFTDPCPYALAGRQWPQTNLRKNSPDSIGPIHAGTLANLPNKIFHYLSPVSN